MDITFVDADTPDFDSLTYVRILVAIAKSDKDNGPPEFNYIRRQAERLGMDYERIFTQTDKAFALGKQNVSRLTALVILKDAITLASMDGNFSLPERQRIYNYAENLDVSRSVVDALEAMVREFHQLTERWQQLVAMD